MTLRATDDVHAPAASGRAGSKKYSAREPARCRETRRRELKQRLGVDPRPGLTYCAADAVPGARRVHARQKVGAQFASHAEYASSRRMGRVDGAGAALPGPLAQSHCGRALNYGVWPAASFFAGADERAARCAGRPGVASRTARGKPAATARLPRARVGDGGGEITALTSSSRSEIGAARWRVSGVMAAETTDVGDGGSSFRGRLHGFGACMKAAAGAGYERLPRAVPAGGGLGNSCRRHPARYSLLANFALSFCAARRLADSVCSYGEFAGLRVDAFRLRVLAQGWN